ncbi:unnamed protein product [Closterium sp. NIES-53]
MMVVREVSCLGLFATFALTRRVSPRGDSSRIVLCRALSPRRLSVECGWGIAGFGERHPTPSGSYALLSPPCFRSTQAAPPPLHHAAATVTVSSYDVSSGAVAPAPLPPSTAAEGLSHSVSAPCFSMEPRNWLEYSGRASTDLLGS